MMLFVFMCYTANMNTYRLPHVAITVANISETKNFYEEIGFVVREGIYAEEKKTELVDKHISLLKDISVSSLGVKNLNIVDPSGMIIEFFEVKYE